MTCQIYTQEAVIFKLSSLLALIGRLVNSSKLFWKPSSTLRRAYLNRAIQLASLSDMCMWSLCYLKVCLLRKVFLIFKTDWKSQAQAINCSLIKWKINQRNSGWSSRHFAISDNKIIKFDFKIKLDIMDTTWLLAHCYVTDYFRHT